MTKRKYNRAYWLGEACHEAAAPEETDIVPIDLDGLDEWREKIKNGSLPFKGQTDS